MSVEGSEDIVLKKLEDLRREIKSLLDDLRGGSLKTKLLGRGSD